MRPPARHSYSIRASSSGPAVREWRQYYRYMRYKKWSESHNMKVSWDRYHLAIMFVDR